LSIRPSFDRKHPTHRRPHVPGLPLVRPGARRDPGVLLAPLSMKTASLCLSTVVRRRGRRRNAVSAPPGPRARRSRRQVVHEAVETWSAESDAATTVFGLAPLSLQPRTPCSPAAPRRQGGSVPVIPRPPASGRAGAPTPTMTRRRPARERHDPLALHEAEGRGHRDPPARSCAARPVITCSTATRSSPAPVRPAGSGRPP